MNKEDALIIIKNGLRKHIANLIKSTNMLWNQTSYIPKNIVTNFNDIKHKVKVSKNDIIGGNIKIGWQGINSTAVPDGSMIIDFDKYVEWKYGDWNVDELKVRFPEFITNEKYYKEGGRTKIKKAKKPISKRKLTFYKDDKKSDAKRPAKLVGYRIKGNHKRKYDKPTKKEIERGYAIVGGKKYSIYSEFRPERSDFTPKGIIKLKAGGFSENDKSHKLECGGSTKKEEGGLTDRFVLFYDSGTGNVDTELGRYSDIYLAKSKANNLINKNITNSVKVFDEVNNTVVYAEEQGMITDFSESYLQKQIAEAGMYIQPNAIFLKSGGKIPYRITVRRFEEILGCEPDYPYEYYKGKKYVKRFLQPFYERTK